MTTVLEFEPISLVTGTSFGDRPTRSTLVQKKQSLVAEREASLADAKREPADSPERKRLYKVVQSLQLEEEQLGQMLGEAFIPQHSPTQLISPRAFFVSPLFRVAGRQTPREPVISLKLTTHSKESVLEYSGPELRQSDGMVFMTLLRLARDTQVGNAVLFSPEEVCKEVFGRYDGPTRVALKDHIKRLQKGLVEFGKTSVQLCLRFDFPSKGPWSVVVDKDIVALFEQSTAVWIDRDLRKQVPEGLASWMYGFIESQTRLIPTPLTTLRSLSGSDASEESFSKLCRRALNDLEQVGVVEGGWHVTKGTVHWMKKLGYPDYRVES